MTLPRRLRHIPRHRLGIRRHDLEAGESLHQDIDGPIERRRSPRIAAGEVGQDGARQLLQPEFEREAEFGRIEFSHGGWR